MKVLYVAPRYHTNQIPVMEGWLKNGDQVIFISQMTNAREDHVALRPIILGYSMLYNYPFHLLNKIWKHVLPDELFSINSKKGFPPYFKLKKIIKEFIPDIAILRERSIYTAVSYYICKRLGVPSILYNQSPYWIDKGEKHNNLKKIFKSFFPAVRMTPVLGFSGKGKVCDTEAYYVPFVMDPYCNIESKMHFLEDKVQIICVAGYHERKKIPMLIEAVKMLKDRYAIHLCIVGEVNSQDQKEYYNFIEGYVVKMRMQSVVTLHQNLERKQIFAQYKKSDLFVLPSTRERASISQLEAMSCSLPVICSDTNGAACQVKEGLNGYLFRDESLSDLTKKIKLAIQDKEHLLQMGQAAYKIVCTDYSFERYKENIIDILTGIKENRK